MMDNCKDAYQYRRKAVNELEGIVQNLNKVMSHRNDNLSFSIAYLRQAILKEDVREALMFRLVMKEEIVKMNAEDKRGNSFDLALKMVSILEQNLLDLRKRSTLAEAWTQVVSTITGVRDQAKKGLKLGF